MNKVLKEFIENAERERRMIRPFLILSKQLEGVFSNAHFIDALNETIGDESLNALKEAIGIPDDCDYWTESFCEFCRGEISEEDFWERTDAVIDDEINKANERADQAEAGSSDGE